MLSGLCLRLKGSIALRILHRFRAEDAEDSVPLQSSSEAVAAMALLRRHCSAIEGSGLALDCLDTVEQAVARYAMSSKKQATLTLFFFFFIQINYCFLFKTVSNK